MKPLCRFYKLHERKCEPIIMTVPRKVSLRLYQVINMLLFYRPSAPYSILLMTFPVSSPPVGSVPGRPVPRHSRAWSRPGGRGVVRREERRPHPDLTQRWIRLHEEPRSESGQDERLGDQASLKSRKHPDCPEACFSSALSSEYPSIFHCSKLFFPFNYGFYFCFSKKKSALFKHANRICCWRLD